MITQLFIDSLTNKIAFDRALNSALFGNPLIY